MFGGHSTETMAFERQYLLHWTREGISSEGFGYFLRITQTCFEARCVSPLSQEAMEQWRGDSCVEENQRGGKAS